MPEIDYAKIGELAKRIVESRKESASRREGSGNAKWYEMKDVNNLRLLGVPGSTMPTMIVKRHVKLPGARQFMNCPHTYPELGFQCPICDISNSLRSREIEPKGELWEAAYTNVLDRDIKDRLEVQIARLSVGVNNDITIAIGLSSGIGNPLDDENGRDLTIIRKKEPRAGGSIGTSYPTVQFSFGQSPIHLDPEVRRKVIESRYDLTSIFRKPNASFIAELKVVADMIAVSAGVPLPTPTVQTVSDVRPASSVDKVFRRHPDPNVLCDDSGKPLCYGKEFDRNLPKCQICPYDIACSAEVRAKAVVAS